jgi:hypothetical protein
MAQSASHTSSKAHRPVVAATTRAIAVIVPTVIVQNPVCDRLALGNEMVGKRARMLTRQITVGYANSCASAWPRDRCSSGRAYESGQHRAYGVVVGCAGTVAGAGADFMAAGGVPSSMLDAWRRVLGTTRSKATTEITMARIKGNQPLPLSSTSGSVDIYSSVGF